MKIDYSNIKISSDEIVQEAVCILEKEKLIACPTETVYGLGGDATSDKAISLIYSFKNRPKINPLICHVINKQMAYRYCYETKLSNLLAEAFWPGPVTMILDQKKNNGISKLVSGNLDSLAIRHPKNTIFEKVISKLDRPIAAPSANISGNVSPTNAIHVYEEFGNQVELIIDGGASEKGIESTVIDARGDHPIILRHGPITSEIIESKINLKVFSNFNTNIVESPGQLFKHYSPTKKLIINSLRAGEHSSYLGFKNIMPDNKFKGEALNLSKNGNLEEAAANLFTMIRYLDKNKSENIMVAPIPKIGIGIAINDRLERAAK